MATSIISSVISSTQDYDIVKMPPGSMHYAKRVDKNGKFIKWESANPEIALEKQKRLELCNLILPHATEWEKSFLESIKNRRTLSDKQIRVWDKILKDYTTVGLLSDN